MKFLFLFFFLPADLCRRSINTRLQALHLLLSNGEAVGCATAGSCRSGRGGNRRHCLRSSSSSGRGMASLAFHRLSWTMAAPVHVPLAVLLIGNCISWAPPFLPVSSTASPRLWVSIAGETQMEWTPSHCNHTTKIRTLYSKYKKKGPWFLHIMKKQCRHHSEEQS